MKTYPQVSFNIYECLGHSFEEYGKVSPIENFILFSTLLFIKQISIGIIVFL